MKSDKAFEDFMDTTVLMKHLNLLSPRKNLQLSKRFFHGGHSIPRHSETVVTKISNTCNKNTNKAYSKQSAYTDQLMQYEKLPWSGRVPLIRPALYNTYIPITNDT